MSQSKTEMTLDAIERISKEGEIKLASNPNAYMLTILCDIALSLAIIADKMREEQDATD